LIILQIGMNKKAYSSLCPSLNSQITQARECAKMNESVYKITLMPLGHLDSNIRPIGQEGGHDPTSAMS